MQPSKLLNFAKWQQQVSWNTSIFIRLTSYCAKNKCKGHRLGSHLQCQVISSSPLGADDIRLTGHTVTLSGMDTSILGTGFGTSRLNHWHPSPDRHVWTPALTQCRGTGSQPSRNLSCLMTPPPILISGEQKYIYVRTSAAQYVNDGSNGTNIARLGIWLFVYALAQTTAADGTYRVWNNTCRDIRIGHGLDWSIGLIVWYH